MINRYKKPVSYLIMDQNRLIVDCDVFDVESNRLIQTLQNTYTFTGFLALETNFIVSGHADYGRLVLWEFNGSQYDLKSFIKLNTN